METEANTENEPALAGAEGQQQAPAISHLQRREIQAPIAACLIHGFVDALGEAKALDIASAAIREDARKSGQAMAEKLGTNTLEALRQVVDEVWAEGGAAMIRVLEASDRKLSFDVTRCRYAEMYEALGLKDLGFCLSCSRDESFAADSTRAFT